MRESQQPSRICRFPALGFDESDPEAVLAVRADQVHTIRQVLGRVQLTLRESWQTFYLGVPFEEALRIWGD